MTALNVEVVVYSDAARVELYLNGELVDSATQESHSSVQGSVSVDSGNGVTQGIRSYNTYKATDGVANNSFRPVSGHASLYATFDVPYEAGTLTAKAFDENGIEITNTEGRKEVKTTGAAAQLSLSADRTVIDADGKDLTYITIDVEDSQGNFVNGLNDGSQPSITVTITGEGKLLALDSGAQADHTPHTDSTWDAFSGKLVAIVQSTDNAGSFTVEATSNGLTSDRVTVNNRAVAGDEVDASAVVGYKLSRNHYLKLGGSLTMPEEVVLIKGDGSEERKTLTWDISSVDTSVVGTYAVSATAVDFPVVITANVTVLDQLAGVLNYSTALLKGGILNLPSTRPVVTLDGEVMEEVAFPVVWDDASFNSNIVGTTVVTGTANIFGLEQEVTASVRVAEGSIEEDTNQIGSAHALYAGEVISSELENVRDNDVTTMWTGRDARFYYATAINLYKVVIDYDTIPSEHPVIAWSPDGTTWNEVTPTVSSNGTTVTYTLDTLVPAVWTKISNHADMTIKECQLITGLPSFPLHNQAVLSSMTVNGKEADEISMSLKEYPTQAILVEDLVIESDVNASYTVLPELDDVVKILVVAENQLQKSEYNILLGQTQTGNMGGADDGSNDYDYLKTTVTVASEHSNHQNYEGPKEFAIDHLPGTYWHTEWNANLTNRPEDRWIQLELEQETEIAGYRYLPRPGAANGTITGYRIEVSTDGTNFTEVASGSWEKSDGWKMAKFAPVSCKYVRLYGVETRAESGDNRYVTAAEIRVTTPVIDNSVVSLENASLSGLLAYDYSGLEITVEDDLEVTVDGNVLTYGLDYLLTYENNIEPGSGTVTVTGIVNYSGSVSEVFTINAAELTIGSYEPVSVVSFVGIPPELPATVSATMTTGAILDVEVLWDSIPENSYGGVGTFQVNGTIPAYQDYSVEGTVRVVEGLLDRSNLALDRSPTLTSYPMALSSRSSTDYARFIQDGAGIGATSAWSDWVRDTYFGESWAGVLLQEKDESLKTKVNEINVYLADEGSALQEPKSYHVEYYTGPDYELVTTSDVTKSNVALWADSPLNDNRNWTEVEYITKDPVPDIGASGSKVYEKVNALFQPVEADLIRVRLVAANETSWVGMSELEVMGIQYSTADKTPLETLVNTHQDKVQGENTNSSWNAFLRALENAQEVLVNPLATQTQVNQAMTDLESAVDGLTTEPLVVTITFDSTGGSPITGRETQDDGTLPTLPQTVREGYRFLGWFMEGVQEAVTVSTVYSENTLLTARWELLPEDIDPETFLNGVLNSAEMFYDLEGNDEIFDGTKKVDVSQHINDVQGLTEGTIIIRAKMDPTVSGVYSPLLGIDIVDSSVSDRMAGSFGFHQAGGYTVRMELGNGLVSSAATNIDLTDGQWHTIALVYDENEIFSVVTGL